MPRIYLVGKNELLEQKFTGKRNFELLKDDEYGKADMYKLKEQRKHIDFKTKMTEIVKKSLENVRQCEFTIVYLDSYKIDEDTMCKIMYSYMLSKAVYIVYDGRLEDLHDWVLNFSRGVYLTPESLLEDLK